MIEHPASPQEPDGETNGADRRPEPGLLTVRLNPPASDIVTETTEILAIAADDSTFLLEPVQGRALDLDAQQSLRLAPQELAIVGWSSLGPLVLHEMGAFMGAGTHIEIVVDPRLVDVEALRGQCAGHLDVHITELPAGAEAVASLVRSKLFDQVILLGYRDALDADDADARTLLTGLAIRARFTGSRRVRTVVELLDERHASLAEAARVDDFVVSDKLTSQMLAQLSENPGLRQVLVELFRAKGNSIWLLDLPSIAAPGTRLTFADLVATLIHRGLTPIGLLRGQRTCHLSPSKRDVIEVKVDDQLIVIQ